NVGLWEIVKPIGAANRDSGRKPPVAQAIKKEKRGNVPGNGLRLKSSQRAKEAIDIVKARDPVGVEAEGANALQKARIRITLPARLHALVEPGPSLMVRFGIQVIRLLDKELSMQPRILDKGRFGSS